MNLLGTADEADRAQTETWTITPAGFEASLENTRILEGCEDTLGSKIGFDLEASGRTVGVQGLACGLDNIRVAAEPEVVVGTKVQNILRLAGNADGRALLRGDDLPTNKGYVRSETRAGRGYQKGFVGEIFEKDREDISGFR